MNSIKATGHRHVVTSGTVEVMWFPERIGIDQVIRSALAAKDRSWRDCGPDGHGLGDLVIWAIEAETPVIRVTLTNDSGVPVVTRFDHDGGPDRALLDSLIRHIGIKEVVRRALLIADAVSAGGYVRAE